MSPKVLAQTAIQADVIADVEPGVARALIQQAEATTVLGPDGPRLLEDKCSTCIFRPGNPMHLRPGRVRQMVTNALNGGGFITCHKTLRYGEFPDVGEAVCRGFYDAHADRSDLLRTWGRLGGFVEISESQLENGKG